MLSLLCREKRIPNDVMLLIKSFICVIVQDITTQDIIDSYNKYGDNFISIGGIIKLNTLLSHTQFMNIYIYKTY